MKRNVIVLAAAVIATGCVSQKEHQALVEQLAACEADKTAWETRYDRESQRWDDLESSVSSALPTALQEFHQERDRILEMVPEQVQLDVENYLDEYFETVMKGFQVLSEDNEEIKLRLMATQNTLQEMGADTRRVSTAVDQTLAEERQKRDRAAGELAELSADLGNQLAQVVDQVVDFDQSMINCKDCPQRLKLNRNQRETILAFHARLMASLSSLQGRVARPPAPATEALPEESAAAEEAS